MNIISIIFLSIFIVNNCIYGLCIYSLIPLFLFILSVILNIFLSRKYTNNNKSWSILMSIEYDLNKYKLSKYFVFIYILFYLGVLTFLIFVIPSYPLIYWISMTELLPFYSITEPIVSLLLIQLPISLTIYLCVKIYILFQKKLWKKY
jgi:hypothetical protein